MNYSAVLCGWSATKHGPPTWYHTSLLFLTPLVHLVPDQQLRKHALIQMKLKSEVGIARPCTLVGHC